MANATTNQRLRHDGEGGRHMHLPVDTGAHLYKGTCLAQKPLHTTPAAALTFAEVGGTGDTITRASGSWITDGLTVGDTITFSGTASNNITAVIATLTATVITLGAEDLVAETPVAGTVTVTSAESFGLVPLTTALGGHCIGVATMEADNSAGVDGTKRCYLETDRIFCFPNGAGAAAFSDSDQIGSVVYASDDHTASKTVTSYAMGFFYGLDSDGLVRVLVSARIVAHMAALAS